MYFVNEPISAMWTQTSFNNIYGNIKSCTSYKFKTTVLDCMQNVNLSEALVQWYFEVIKWHKKFSKL